MVPPSQLIDNEYSTIVLETVFGQNTKAKLLNVSACQVDEFNSNTRHLNILLTCAITKDLEGQVALLPVCDYENLGSQAEECSPEVKVLSGTILLCDDLCKLHNSQADGLEYLASAVTYVNAITEGRVVKVVYQTYRSPPPDFIRIEELQSFL